MSAKFVAKSFITTFINHAGFNYDQNVVDERKTKMKNRKKKRTVTSDNRYINFLNVYQHKSLIWPTKRPTTEILFVILKKLVFFFL